ncbi:MAG TPA: hypothetical protein VN238_11975 [Solirubrobacteraceae bacterium]|nr:hypothetical protein [Solirubrobacteraceae bacterium]
MCEDLNGRHVQCRYPNWQPLIDLVGEELANAFMWMDELELSDGCRIHAYKHRTTRRYLHLSETTAAFLYTAADQYRPVPTHGQLAVLLYHWAALDRTRAPDSDAMLELLGRIERVDVGARPA